MTESLSLLGGERPPPSLRPPPGPSFPSQPRPRASREPAECFSPWLCAAGGASPWLRGHRAASWPLRAPPAPPPVQAGTSELTQGWVSTWRVELATGRSDFCLHRER